MMDFGGIYLNNDVLENMIFGSESALAQLDLSVIFVMARDRASNL